MSADARLTALRAMCATTLRQNWREGVRNADGGHRHLAG
jgi:hypothetical protein